MNASAIMRLQSAARYIRPASAREGGGKVGNTGHRSDPNRYFQECSCGPSDTASSPGSPIGHASDSLAG